MSMLIATAQAEGKGAADVTEDGFSQQEWEDALELSLRYEPRSAAAGSFVNTLLAALPFDEKSTRPSTIERRRKALGALLGGLLRHHRQGSIGSHGTARQDFSRPVHGFGFDIFKSVVDAMVSAELLLFKPGRPRWRAGPDFSGGTRVSDVGGGWVARFKLTDDALTNIEAAGIQLDAWRDHWARSVPMRAETLDRIEVPPLIALHASNEWRGGGRVKGEALAFHEDEPGVKAVIEDLQAHNAFMRSVGVTGIDFLGLRRSFNEGEREDRRWRSGGRFYAIRTNGIGTRYENMPAVERLSEIRIGGQSVVEVDLSASQLRLLYALMDTPFPEGLKYYPYDLPGRSKADRSAVKRVVAQALGRGRGRSKTWGKDAVKDYAKETDGRSLQDDFDFITYQDITLAAHPILETLGSPGVPAALQLQFVESEIIRRAMADLRDQGIGSLPVHDSLIVSADCAEETERALKDAFQAEVGDLVGYPTKHHARVALKALLSPQGDGKKVA